MEDSTTMTATTRTPFGQRPHRRHRSGRHPFSRHRQGEGRLRLVLSALLLVAGLASALAAQLALSRQSTADLSATNTEGSTDAPLAAHHAGFVLPMHAPPSGSPSEPPLVPPASPLYGTPPANDAPLTASDRDFLVRVRQAGLWEGEAGRQARARSQSQAVRDAGEHLIAGHTELDAKVLAIAEQLHVPLPSQPSDTQRGWLAEMAAKPTSQDFDRVFVNRARAAHGAVYGVIAQIRAGTRNSIIRAFAQRATEVVLDHMAALERTGLVDFGQLPQPALLPGAAKVPTAQSRYGPLTAADQDFLVRVRLAGLWEGPSGRSAQQSASSPRVKDAGRHLIAGHAELDATVLALGRELGVDLPTEPNRDQKTWLGEMAAAPSAKAFDQVFVDRLRAAHGIVYGFVAAVRAATANSAIRDFAQRTMEVVLDHITVLERTGLVRYDTLALPPPPTPTPTPAATGAAAAAGRRDDSSRLLLYVVGGMIALAAVVTVVASRDHLPRNN